MITSPIEQQDNKYETQQLLNQYLLLHFGDYKHTSDFPFLSENLSGFPKRCAQLLCAKMKEQNKEFNRALDLGCAVGGASFELARHFNEVVGIDLSHSFIATANQIKLEGNIEFARKDEGNFTTTLRYSIDQEIDRERIQFKVGDACALPSDLPQFDAILLANLLCRLPNPKACLAQLTGPQGLLRPGGLLMITSPFSWLKEFTPEQHWLCGPSQSSSEGLHTVLDEHFDLIHEDNMPFVIREHRRKFEYIIAHTTIWICK